MAMSDVSILMSTSASVTITRLLGSVYRHHAMIFALALRDLQSRYAGTLAGILWTVVHPIAIISIFYVVFAIGFKAQGSGGTPFVLWFVAGFVPWLFFNETLTAITDSVTRNAHLVKKTVFPSEILAPVHVTAALIPHGMFILILAALLASYRILPHIQQMLFIYYLGCTVVLVLGLGWLLSALQVFYRDISHGLTIALNFWFWATPIVWTPSNMPDAYRWVLSYNPLFYIVEGYRTALLFDSSWPTLWQTVYFWAVTLFTFGLGAYTFARLKPEFAEVM